jgi:hypothetical protein
LFGCSTCNHNNNKKPPLTRRGFFIGLGRRFGQCSSTLTDLALGMKALLLLAQVLHLIS